MSFTLIFPSPSRVRARSRRRRRPTRNRASLASSSRSSSPWTTAASFRAFGARSPPRPSRPRLTTTNLPRRRSRVPSRRVAPTRPSGRHKKQMAASKPNETTCQNACNIHADSHFLSIISVLLNHVSNASHPMDAATAAAKTFVNAPIETQFVRLFPQHELRQRPRQRVEDPQHEHRIECGHRKH